MEFSLSHEPGHLTSNRSVLPEYFRHKGNHLSSAVFIECLGQVGVKVSESLASRVPGAFARSAKEVYGGKIETNAKGADGLLYSTGRP